MAFIKSRLGDAVEPTTPPEGNYDLRIVTKEAGRNKAGTRDQVRCYIVIEGDDDYMGINHWLTIPSEEDWQEEPDKAKRMELANRRFLTMFGVQYTAEGFDDDDLPGATAHGLVKLDAGDDGTPYPRVVPPRID